MKLYFAPMEGITLYPLRNIHKEMFGNALDKYFTPFVSTARTYKFKKREQRDILPEFCSSFSDYKNEVVPQIMGNKAEQIVWAARKMHELGYNEVNLNMGCPVATVVNRHKGSGLLEDTDKLDEMLFEIFDTIDKENLQIKFSLKTRLGMHDDSESLEIMKVLAKYPASELTIHARVRDDYYKGQIRPEAFCRAVRVYRENGGAAPIVYNGDINSASDFQKISGIIDEHCGEIKGSTDNKCISLVDRFMLGRGLIINPALAREIAGGEVLKADELRVYLDRLYDAYAEYIPEDQNVIFKMLEHWAFIHVHFRDCEKYLKAIRKSRSKGEYKAAVTNMFSSCEFVI
ncbi:MAG: tRNA-dihydrouridine synthase family protein [Butyrivibrio sp.]|uniref:tRNA dihydrouridine synthase n=1 Tax=Butyrivibrio sp. TaxID=28121 RepID=UPI001B2E09E6|nr:tRNA-dihydrouridine synthase family protein [Butyrivibrio sp.]MBO6241071.1 tRNA-dihydrouridine synthase family protein [Butyrivibrio sp.]